MTTTMEFAGSLKDNNPIDSLNVSDTWKKRFRILEKAGDLGVFGYENRSRLAFSERFSIGFSFLAFFFGPFYYFFKGMYQKGFVLLGCGFIVAFLVTVVENFAGPIVRPLHVGPIAITCATLASYDYYRLKVKQETMWEALGAFRQVWVAITFAGAAIVLHVAGLTVGETAVNNLKLAHVSFDNILPGKNLLTEVSGVWRDDEGTVVEISLDGDVKRIKIAQRAVQVQIKDAHKADGTIVLKPDTAHQVWTLRQIKEGERSSLRLTIDDRIEANLAFVRPL